MNTNTRLLKIIAEIITDIDDDKNLGGERIPQLLDLYRDSVEEMKMELLDIGTLPDVLVDLRLSSIAVIKSGELCAKAHAEIARLAGADAHLIYSPEDEIVRETLCRGCLLHVPELPASCDNCVVTL